jgi:hypothetical protein
MLRRSGSGSDSHFALERLHFFLMMTDSPVSAISLAITVVAAMKPAIGGHSLTLLQVDDVARHERNATGTSMRAPSRTAMAFSVTRPTEACRNIL